MKLTKKRRVGIGQRRAVSGGTVAAVERPIWEGSWGRTARERLAKLLDDAEAPGAFSVRILATGGRAAG